MSEETKLAEIFNRLVHIETDVAGMKVSVSQFDRYFASQQWVHDELRPLREAIQSNAAQMQQQSKAMEELAKRQGDLFAAHDKFLAEESARKTEMHNAQMEALRKWSVANVAKVAVAIAVGIMAITGAWAVLAPMFHQAVIHAK